MTQSILIAITHLTHGYLLLHVDNNADIPASYSLSASIFRPITSYSTAFCKYSEALIMMHNNNIPYELARQNCTTEISTNENNNFYPIDVPFNKHLKFLHLNCQNDKTTQSCLTRTIGALNTRRGNGLFSIACIRPLFLFVWLDHLQLSK